MKPLNPVKSHPFLQKIKWVIDPVGYMENAVAENADIFSTQIVGFGDGLIFVNNPQAIQEILTNDRKKYNAPGKLNGILRPLLGDYSTIMIDGDRHRQRRQLVMPSFHGDRMKSYGELIVNLTKKVMDELPINQPFLAREKMQEISMQVIIESVFGLHEGERCQEIKGLMEEMSQLFRSPLSSSALFFHSLQKDLGAWSPWGKFVRDRAKLDELLYAEIAQRRANPDSSRIDILELLMSAKDENGEGLNDQELRDELMTLLFAGHETTATAMSWGLYWSHHLPETRQKILQELSQLSNFGDTMSIFRLPYLTAFCNETLRIYPVAMLTFPRVAQEDTEILGHQIQKGATVIGCMYLIHQREDLYPQPKQFKPERFLERQFSPYEFIPFGGGSRRCIGEALALFEMKLVLATILSNYQLELVDSQPEKPRRRGVTLSPAKGVKMMLKGKNASINLSKQAVTV
ncbi:cytochrome P450 [Calothrix sp. PCC 6303]|uniref:cytochrome P450 n=1 Tax=Calothrix sp. PCC 6303 TaxID=1170562 RepID=UPI0002A00F97|nr:cytochrome P450 [Calothrix sp. PCC 6303]AFZ00287.1 Unspecific monooxygenase [Calothrix sp. PCC 6303]